MATVLPLLIGPGSCSSDDPGTLEVRIVVHNEQFRPDFAWISWLTPDGSTLKHRLPPNGALPATGTDLGTLQVQIARTDRALRRVVVKGMRGERLVSEAAARLNLPDHPTATLVLGAPLPDTDGDGIPDLVDDLCNPAVPACVSQGKDAGADVAPDGAPADGLAASGPDAGVARDSSAPERPVDASVPDGAVAQEVTPPSDGRDFPGSDMGPGDVAGPPDMAVDAVVDAIPDVAPDASPDVPPDRAPLPCGMMELSKTGWFASASNMESAAMGPARAIDGELTSRYAAGDQAVGQWFRIELPAPVEFCSVTMDAALSDDDIPSKIDVHVSSNGSAWTLVAAGVTAAPVTRVSFAPITARYVRITIQEIVAFPNTWWSIHEIFLYR